MTVSPANGGEEVGAGVGTGVGVGVGWLTTLIVAVALPVRSPSLTWSAIS